MRYDQIISYPFRQLGTDSVRGVSPVNEENTGVIIRMADCSADRLVHCSHTEVLIIRNVRRMMIGGLTSYISLEASLPAPGRDSTYFIRS
jgi:hypothetical protein